MVFQLQTRVESLTKKAKFKGADLVVFPEAFISSYPKGMDFGARVGQRSSKGREDFERYFSSSLALDSKEYLKLLDIAKKNKVLLVDSSGGEVIRPCLRNGSLKGISDDDDPLKFNLVLSRGHKEYINWIKELTLSRLKNKK